MSDRVREHLRRRRFTIVSFVAVVVAAGAAYSRRHQLRYFVRTGEWRTRQTVQQILVRLEPQVRQRFEFRTVDLGVAWPPKRLMLLAFKAEALLELWIANTTGPFRRLKVYRILKQSGGPGPKRAQGDGQVPEGFYTLPALNPNSMFHLSIKVSYPNQDDISHSTIPRDRMGGDIFVHGGKSSIGCLAMGDSAIEELFTIAALVPASNRQIIISPIDLRNRPAPDSDEQWIQKRYSRIAQALRNFPVTGPASKLTPDAK